jgi:hypothetical protein
MLLLPDMVQRCTLIALPGWRAVLLDATTMTGACRPILEALADALEADPLPMLRDRDPLPCRPSAATPERCAAGASKRAARSRQEARR